MGPAGTRNKIKTIVNYFLENCKVVQNKCFFLNWLNPTLFFRYVKHMQSINVKGLDQSITDNSDDNSGKPAVALNVVLELEKMLLANQIET